MSDPIDDMLRDGDQPGASPAPNDGQPTDPNAGQQPDEEVEFNKLSGSAQERIREMWRRARTAEEERDTLRQQQPNVPPAPQLDANTQQRQALETLDQAGVATKDFTKREVTQGIAEIKLELRNQNLVQKYMDAPVQFNPDEIEDYKRTHPQYASYDPEDVFLYKMYPDEFANQRQTQTKRSSNIRPTKQMQRQDALTPEYIEERLKQPDGDEWYEKNKDEINKVVYNHTQQFKGVNFGA